MKLKEMTKEERSLLLYIESVSTDEAGLVDSRKINDADRVILKTWDESGFVSFSRISWESVQKLVNRYATDRVYLSEDAWKLAHEERRDRNVRMCNKEPYRSLVTTKSMRAEFVVSPNPAP